jgi:hypothetical protein
MKNYFRKGQCRFNNDYSTFRKTIENYGTDFIGWLTPGSK